MRRVLPAIAVLLLAGIPAQAGKGQVGLGIGYTLGPGESDVATEDVDFIGGTALVSVGLARHWDLLFTYRLMIEDSLPFPVESEEYDQLALYGVYTWRPAKFLRPRLKLGYASTDAEFTSFVGNTESDRGGAYSAGGGLEFGRRASGFVEVDRTEPEVFDVDVEFTHLTLGFVYRFRGKQP